MPDLLDTTGRRITALRGYLGLSQKELARQLNAAGVEISRGHLSRLETTAVVSSADVIAGLARILGTTADYLLLLTDDSDRPGESEDEETEKLVRESATGYAVAAEEMALLEMFRRLPRDARQPIAELLASIVELGQVETQRFLEKDLLSWSDDELITLVRRAEEIVRRRRRGRSGGGS